MLEEATRRSFDQASYDLYRRDTFLGELRDRLLLLVERHGPEYLDEIVFNTSPELSHEMISLARTLLDNGDESHADPEPGSDKDAEGDEDNDIFGNL